MMEIKQIETELLKLRLGSLGWGLLWLAGWLGRSGGRVEQAALPCHHRHSEGQRDDDNSMAFSE